MDVFCTHCCVCLQKSPIVCTTNRVYCMSIETHLIMINKEFLFVYACVLDIAQLFNGFSLSICPFMNIPFNHSSCFIILISPHFNCFIVVLFQTMCDIVLESVLLIPFGIDVLWHGVQFLIIIFINGLVSIYPHLSIHLINKQRTNQKTGTNLNKNL